MADSFDQYAEKYDKWFLANENVLKSEAALLAHFTGNPGRALSVGCGSGLFEKILEKDYNIQIKEGIEPSKDMADIAIKRGMEVRVGTAEDTEFGIGIYDTVIFNGTPSYITDLEKAFMNAFKALKTGGKIVVLDVPKESSYALLYNLAKEIGTWDHPALVDVQPPNAYPIEFVSQANWRTTSEKIDLLKKCGFDAFEFAQTLTKHPLYSDNKFEEPVEGFDKGDYVAIRATKKG